MSNLVREGKPLTHRVVVGVYARNPAICSLLQEAGNVIIHCFIDDLDA